MTAVNQSPAAPSPPTANLSGQGANWTTVRARFPALQGHLYLNTASRGLLPLEAVEAGKGYYDAMYADAAVGLSSHWGTRLEAARETVATFIGAQSSSVAFMPNASTGLNLLADLFRDPGPPGEVLLHRDEFPSVSFPWVQRDHPLRFLEPDATGTVSTSSVEAAIGPRTRFLALSTVQYASGFAADLPELGELCRRRGLRLICDATQAVGAVPTDVRSFQPDGLVFSGYKWACAGYGVAALYIAPQHLERRWPAAGWRTAAQPYSLLNDRVEHLPQALALELGNPLLPGPLVLAASLGVLADIGIEVIAARVRHLGQRLRFGLQELGLVVRSPTGPSAEGGITLFEHEDPERLERELAAASVHVSARQGKVRVSPHLYNNEEDIERFLAVLRG